jgi:Icc-related predicted phosphoesterase
MKVVCLSDTHNLHDRIEVPEADLLIHAGDATMKGTRDEVSRFAEWIRAQPHRYKILVAGNHDFLFEREPDEARRMFDGVTYLQDSGVTIEGLAIWGSPWQPWFRDWAFNLERGEPLRAVWSLIPEGTDLLITHGPPYGILDEVALAPHEPPRDRHAGCEDLLAAVGRIRPRVHLFGHIHEAYGTVTRDGTAFVNASNCNRAYQPVNPPIVLEL